MRIGFSFGVGPLRVYVPVYRSKARRRPYWTHPGCTIRHSREDTAKRCEARMRSAR